MKIDGELVEVDLDAELALLQRTNGIRLKSCRIIQSPRCASEIETLQIL